MISFQFEPKAKVAFGKREESPQANTDLSSSSSLSIEPPNINSMVNAVYSMGWLVLAGGANAAGSLYTNFVSSAGNSFFKSSVAILNPTTGTSPYSALATRVLYGTSLAVAFAGTLAASGLTAYCIYNAVGHLYKASKGDFLEKKDAT